MVVDGSKQAEVTWTQPDDLSPSAENPLHGLVGIRRGGILAVLRDGSVRFISDSLEADTINALFTISGRESFKLD